MRKLLILGKAQANVEIIRYAKSLGVHTIVTATEDENNCISKKFCDEQWSYSTADLDLLEQKCKEEGIDAIFCGISEFNIDRLIELGQRLNLPVYCDHEAWSYSRDKMKFRKLCEQTGVPMAQYYKVTKEFLREDLDKVVYPVVVKPVDRNGNRGISFCDNEEELIKGYEYALSLSNSDKIVVERKLVGPEFGASYVIADGNVSLLSFEAMCSQPGYPSNCYSFETTDTKELDHYLEELDSKIKQLLLNVGCRDGFAWIEMILDKDGHFYVLEMGHRMNGEMTFKAFPKSYGFDVIKWMTDIALGVKHTKNDLPKSLTKKTDIAANVYAFWTKKEGTIKRISGLEELKTIPDINFSFAAQEGDHVGQFRHIGTAIFNSTSIKNKIDTITAINKQLVIEDEFGNDMIIRYDNFDSFPNI